MSSKTDISAFLKSLDQAQRAIATRAASAAVYKFANRVMKDAVILAPIGGGIYSRKDPSPGALKDSATVLDPEVKGTRIEVTMGFNTVYAAAQHERLDYRHDQGQAKYLETAVRGWAPELNTFVKNEIVNALKESS